MSAKSLAVQWWCILALGLLYAQRSVLAQEYELIWEENFDGDSINPNNWDHEITAWGGGNGEFQVYTDDPMNSYVRDGLLYLKPSLLEDNTNPLTGEPFGPEFLHNGVLDLEAMYGRCTNNDNGGCYRTGAAGNIPPTMSARIRSHKRFSFKFGRTEIVAKMPVGDWMWPAMWLLPEYWVYGGWPRSGEIDVTESIGNRDYVSADDGSWIGIQKMGSTLHWGMQWDDNRWYLTNGHMFNEDENYGDHFHLYAMDWDENGFIFYIDGAEVARYPDPLINENPEWVDWYKYGAPWWSTDENPWEDGTNMAPFDEDFHFILNVAIGGNNGFFPDGGINHGGAFEKPWTNNDGYEDAMRKFYTAKDDWYWTWQEEGENSTMQVDSIKVYQKVRNATSETEATTAKVTTATGETEETTATGGTAATTVTGETEATTATPKADFLVDPDDMREMFEDAFGVTRERHHNNGEGKERAREYIQNFVPSENLHKQSFQAIIEDDSTESTGINFIYVLRGLKWGTAEDRPMLVGAHYDTVLNSSGVDDNGSGMVALLSAGKYITDYLEEKKQTLKYTLFFVAFDFEETASADYDWLISLGSDVFVNKFFVPDVLDKYQIPHENFQGAIILETMMNWDDTDNSQNLPAGFEQMFPEEYPQFVERGRRGDFLAIISREDDIELGNNFEKQWEDSADSEKYRTWLIELPFSGRPDSLPQEQEDMLNDLFRSDHYRFWNQGTKQGLKAIQLTDTADFRSNCYHSPCDDLDSINDDKLKFLAKITDTVIQLALEATQPEGTLNAANQFGGCPHLIPLVAISYCLFSMW